MTTILLWIVRTIWKGQIQPWYENALYKDIRLDSSKWRAIIVGDSADKYEEDVTLNQVGHKVYGTIKCVEGPETDKGRSYEFDGSFRNSILSAKYQTTDRSALDSGSFTLQLTNNGDKLEGHVSFYFDPEHVIHSRPYVWSRV